VLEIFIEGFDAHRADALVNQVAHGVIDYRSRHRGLQPETIRQVRCYIELTPTNVNLAFGCLSEGHDTGVETMDQGA
jgi:hypothetical protein